MLSFILILLLTVNTETQRHIRHIDSASTCAWHGMVWLVGVGRQDKQDRQDDTNKAENSSISSSSFLSFLIPPVLL